jgi:hypothetical protein
VVLGKSANSGGSVNIVIGPAASVTGTVQKNVVIGASATSSAQSSVEIGYIPTTTASNAIAIGDNVTASALRATVLGTGLTNATSDSVLLASTTNGGNNVCDLGTSALKFKDAYLRGVVGTTTNDNAQAGSVGEYQESSVASGAAVTLTTDVNANMTSMALTARDWDVGACITFQAGATTVIQVTQVGVSSTSAALPSDGIGAQVLRQDTAAGNWLVVVTGSKRFALAATTSVYAVANCIFTISTCKVFGVLRARRMR